MLSLGIFLMAGFMLTTTAEAPAPEPGELWGGATAGMMVNQVATLFPQAHKPNYPQQLFSGDLDHPVAEGEEALRDCSLAVDGVPVCGSFFFNRNALFEVILTAPHPGKGVEEASAAAMKLRRAVSRRFADPGMCDEHRETPDYGPGATCRWHVPGLEASVVYIHGTISLNTRTDPPILFAQFLAK